MRVTDKDRDESFRRWAEMQKMMTGAEVSDDEARGFKVGWGMAVIHCASLVEDDESPA